MGIEYYWVLLILVLLIAGIVLNGFLGQHKQIGIRKALLISVFFTPFIGALVVYHSPRKITYSMSFYRCNRCGFEFTEPQEYCPICLKDGEKIHLKRIVKQMT